MITKIRSFLALAFMGLCQGDTHYGLANEAVATTRSAQHWKRKTAMAIGKPSLADGDDEALEAAHDAHMQMANDMADDMPPGPAEASAANEQTPEAKAEADRLAAEKAEKDKKEQVGALANEQVAAVRKENIELQLSNAITTGKITVAEKPAWEAKFANDYDGAKTALGNEKVKVKLHGRTHGLSNVSAAAVEGEQSRRDQVQSLVNEEQSRNGGDYDKAWDSVRRNPKHKALFDAMKKPEPKQ